MKKVLLTATVQSHICQFHKPLVDMLRTTGEFEIHVAARDNLSEKNGLKLDFVDRVYDIPFRRSPFDFKNATAYKQLKKIIEENEYDYIHCNTPVGGVVTRLAARKARKYGTNVFYTAHGFHFYKGASKKNWIFYYPIERLLARYTDKLIAINEEDYLLAKNQFSCQVARIHGVGVDANRYHPVDVPEKEYLRNKLGFSANDRLILCVGELLPNKNQKMAIEAMKSVVATFPNAILLLAGNGSYRSELEKIVQLNQLEHNVRFLGYCTNLEEYQRICEVAISCSIREGLGVNLIEAMLSQNPVIATRNRGHNELVVEGENGYLVDVGDVDGLTKQMITLLADFELNAHLGMRGYEIGKMYDVSVIIEELKEIYFG